MSQLRKTSEADPRKFTPKGGTAYYMILSAVQSRPGLIHGTLNAHGEYCAVGSYFHVHATKALPNVIIDEVAAVNDSVPHFTERQRKAYVIRWLEWKLNQLGMSGFASAAKKHTQATR